LAKKEKERNLRRMLRLIQKENKKIDKVIYLQTFVRTVKDISHHVCFPRVIVDGAVIIIEEFQPPSLAHVEFFLGKEIL
jgi:hypothetical protein